MKQIKYMIHPGKVMSINDGKTYHLNAKTLMALYKVDPEECIVITEFRQSVDKPLSLIHLHPMADDHYDVAKCKTH